MLDFSIIRGCAALLLWPWLFSQARRQLPRPLSLPALFAFWLPESSAHERSINVLQLGHGNGHEADLVNGTLGFSLCHLPCWGWWRWWRIQSNVKGNKGLMGWKRFMPFWNCNCCTFLKNLQWRFSYQFSISKLSTVKCEQNRWCFKILPITVWHKHK